MGFVNRVKKKSTKWVMKHVLKMGWATEIEVDGLIEYKDVPYMNRSGKELKMDIFKPDVDDSIDLPVIVNVHGGGLVAGNKRNSEGFCKLMAKHGYLVFSLEYRLAPAVHVYEQLDDVCAGMDCVGRKLVDFNVDLQRIYMASESAGSLLSLYVCAMKKSKALQEAIDYEPTRMFFKAIGLVSGMFYTKRMDPIGMFLSRTFYGKGEKSSAIKPYTNPENPEIIRNLPPCYLVTSKADFLEKYTLDYARALEKNGIEYRLREMGDDDRLVHAFPVMRPDYPESEQVVSEIIAWFEEHTPESSRP